MDIYDRYGRRISVAVNYSKEEKLTIQALERLSARLAGQQGKEQKEKGWQEKARTLVFFGIPYLAGGSLCPVSYPPLGRGFRPVLSICLIWRSWRGLPGTKASGRKERSRLTMTTIF